MARTNSSGAKAKITLPPRPTRSNAGGAVRGQARAAQVHAANATRKAAPASVKSGRNPDTSTLNGGKVGPFGPLPVNPSGPEIRSFGRMAAPPLVRPASASARSNAGGATRGQARAAQVKAMNKSKGPGPTPASANAMRGRRYANAQRRERATYGKNYSQASAQASASAPAAKGRSAGFNPFGVPSSSVLDAIINSKRKR